MQPSGEVGRFEVDDQPSPPADRKRYSIETHAPQCNNVNHWQFSTSTLLMLTLGTAVALAVSRLDTVFFCCRIPDCLRAAWIVPCCRIGSVVRNRATVIRFLDTDFHRSIRHNRMDYLLAASCTQQRPTDARLPLLLGRCLFPCGLLSRRIHWWNRRTG